MKEAFNPFNAVLPLNVTEAMDAAWTKAVRDYARPFHILRSGK